jgi:hypothetical protein
MNFLGVIYILYNINLLLDNCLIYKQEEFILLDDFYIYWLFQPCEDFMECE